MERGESGIAQNGKSNITPISNPTEVLLEQAQEWGLQVSEREFAAKMDSSDPLRAFRDKFFYPKMGDLPESDADLIKADDDCVYLCTHSLGLQPKGVRICLERELDKWGKMGVHGHMNGKMPWTLCDECIDEPMAALVGAKREEVALMNSLTVNEHLLLISFYRPTPRRHKILLENHAFPSDHYAVESQVRLHGYDPKSSMICVEPRKGEDTLRTEDIVRTIEEQGDSIAVVLFPGVQYYTGQVFDMKAITEAAHAKGCHVGFDLAHAVGNVELHLHDWNVDFACWCTYKYLNSSPGGIAGAFIHERFANNDFPKLHGWWSHRMDTRFKMDNKLERSPGPAGYRISNPPALLCAPVQASMEVFKETSMRELCNKSKLLTAYLELMLKMHFSKPLDGPVTKPYMEIITPSNVEERGGMLSVMFSTAKVSVELKSRGVVVDMREQPPNFVLRITPAPLYNSFEDVFRFIVILGDAIESSRN